MAEASSQEMEGSTNASLDDFTHLTAEKCLSLSTISNSPLTKSQFGQVVFHDLCDVYPTDCDIKCKYSLTDNVNPQPGDKIALFKVGWLSVSEYITFARAQLPKNTDNNIFQVTFPGDALPKDDVDLYQLCYVTSGNVIAGASVPFAFRKPHETEFIAVEDPSDPGLVVFRSRHTQLQEDLNKAVEEKDTLTERCIKLESVCLSLKKELSEAKHSKECISKDFEILEKELQGTRKEKSELEHKILSNPPEKTLIILKDNINVLEVDKNRIQQLLQEKINEIKVHEATIECLKQDRKHLDENLREYISLNESLTLEKDKLQDQLKEDKIHFDKELNKYVLLNHSLTTDKTLLEDRLKELAEKHNTTVLEKLDLAEESKNLKLNIKDMMKRLQEMEELITNLYSDDSKSDDYIKRALIKSDEEKSLIEVKLLTLEEEHSKCNEKIAALKTAEQEALKLLEIEINKMPIEENNPKLPSDETKNDEKMFECICGQSEGEEKIKLSTRLNSVLQEKADLRSELVQIKHDREEISRLVKDINEENAALRSRTNVLEYELSQRSFGHANSSRNSENAILNSLTEKFDEVKTELDKFSESMVVLEKFNSSLLEKSELQMQFEIEKKQKITLQKKIEKLLLEDGELFKELQEMKEKYEQVKKDKEVLENSANGENFLLMQKLLDDSDLVKNQLEEDMNVLFKEKCSLENQLMNLRKEMIGKISLSDAQELKNELAYLREKVKNKDCCSETSERPVTTGMEHGQLHSASKQHNSTAAEELNKVKVDAKDLHLACPLCNKKFPRQSQEDFLKHFENHTF